jgi:hypothetical protein
MRRLVPVGLLVGLLAVPSCGDPPPPADPAALVLRALEARVRGGEGSSDATWGPDVNAVALALWPIDRDQPDPAHAEAHRLHASLSHVAGDVARLLHVGPEARADLAERDPGSLAIHDAFLAAAARAPKEYAGWVTGEGRALLEDLARRRMEALAGERPPR